MGSRSMLARTLTKSNLPWVPSPNAICSFSSEAAVRLFTEDYLLPATNRLSGADEEEIRQKFTTAMYDCVIKDKTAVLPVWMYFVKVSFNFSVIEERIFNF